jgi:hypothetical protein
VLWLIVVKAIGIEYNFVKRYIQCLIFQVVHLNSTEIFCVSSFRYYGDFVFLNLSFDLSRSDDEQKKFPD